MCAHGVFNLSLCDWAKKNKNPATAAAARPGELRIKKSIIMRKKAETYAHYIKLNEVVHKEVISDENGYA